MKSITINVSRMLLLMMGINVLLTSILLLLGVSITKWNFPVSLILVLGLILFKKHQRKEKIIAYVISIICMVIICLLNAFLYELAYDGNMYHKFAIGILSSGYNPIYERAVDYLHLMHIPLERWFSDDIWVECYPKAAWYFNASIYVWSKWIDSSKAFNLVVMFSTLGFCFDYFKDKLSFKRAVLITLIMAITPTSFSMLFSFYIDGALGQLLLSSIIILLSITDPGYTGDKQKQFIYLFFCIMLCANLKITGLCFEAVFNFVFFVYWLLKLFVDKTRKKKEKEKKILSLTIFYFITVVVTVLVVGYGTYITNILRYGNILYPLGALEGFDITNNLKSVQLDHANPLIQILAMIFVKTNTDDSLNYLEWKIPFTFTKDQLIHSTCDVVRGGTGIFYSGILIIGIMMFVYLRGKVKKRNEDHILSRMVIVVSLILLAVVPAGGQVRYSPYVFFPVAFIIYEWLLVMERGDFTAIRLKVVPYIMGILLMLNVIPFFNYTVRAVVYKGDLDHCYEEMKSSEHGIIMDTSLPGIVFNLADRNINYEYSTNKKLSETIKYLWLSYELKD